MVKDSDFLTKVQPTWCPGCGNFGIATALRKAFVELSLEPHQVVMVFDIGCAGNSANWYKVYGFHSLHGRTIPVAFGVHLANHQLKVIAISGDGGAYGEGGNHFIHTCRANPDITLIVSNNQLYSLTTGQFAPTTEQGVKTKTSPQGTIEVMFNPMQVAISCGASFVSRGFSDDISHLTDLLKKAITHQGFSLVDVLQPCVTLNKINTREWYKERIYKLQDSNYQPNDKDKALLKADEWGKKIPIGIFYQEKKPTYVDFLPQLKEKTLVEQEIKIGEISELLKEFK